MGWTRATCTYYPHQPASPGHHTSQHPQDTSQACIPRTPHQSKEPQDTISAHTGHHISAHRKYPSTPDNQNMASSASAPSGGSEEHATTASPGGAGRRANRAPPGGGDVRRAGTAPSGDEDERRSGTVPSGGGETKRSTVTEHGFEAVFEPRLEVRLTCPVCWAALRDPIQTKCGHRFCRSCLKKCCLNRFGKCPVDNTWLDMQREVFSDIAIKREVLSLNIKCGLHEEGCTWMGELRDDLIHQGECRYVEDSCENGCGATRMRRDMERHLEECPLRLVPCPHCREDITAINSTKHQVLACPRFPVNCGICGETGILREDVPRHMDLESGNCPLVTVNCPFYNSGCYFQTKRKNMDEHMRSSVSNHLQLLATRQTSHGEAMGNMHRELESLISKVSNLAKQLTETSDGIPSRLSHIEQEVETNRTRLETFSRATGTLTWNPHLPAGNGATLCSPPLYTAQPGYKFSVSLSLGDDTAEGAEPSTITVHVEPSEFDDQLTFPYDGVCSVFLIKSSTPQQQQHQQDSIHIPLHQVARCPLDGASSASAGSAPFKTYQQLANGNFINNGRLRLIIHIGE